MTTPRQPKPESARAPTGTARQDTGADKQSDELDEALDESFPASDPVAINITAVDPPVPPR